MEGCGLWIYLGVNVSSAVPRNTLGGEIRAWGLGCGPA